MSEQVTRAEFNELKGQLNLLCEKFGIEVGELVSPGTGKRRAEVPETETSPYSGPAENDHGWESINDDEVDHGIVYTPRMVIETANHENDEDVEENSYAAVVSDEKAYDGDEYGEESLAESENDSSVNANDESSADESNNVTAEQFSEIFDKENALTGNNIASKKFTTISKGLFSSPYSEDQVDDVLDKFYETLNNRDVSEKTYAESLLSLSSVSFGEAASGYKKAEVDGFINEVKAELERRIAVLSS